MPCMSTLILRFFILQPVALKQCREQKGTQSLCYAFRAYDKLECTHQFCGPRLFSPSSGPDFLGGLWRLPPGIRCCECNNIDTLFNTAQRTVFAQVMRQSQARVWDARALGGDQE